MRIAYADDRTGALTAPIIFRAGRRSDRPPRRLHPQYRRRGPPAFTRQTAGGGGLAQRKRRRHGGRARAASALRAVADERMGDEGRRSVREREVGRGLENFEGR